MDKNSKRRHIAAKGIKAKLSVLPTETLEKLAKVPNNWRFPEHVSNMPVGVADTEARKFHLCFDFFNWKTSVWTQFDDTKAKALILVFEGVTKCEARKLPELKIVRDSVSNTPIYASLFSGLSPDVDLKEGDLPGGGKIFFFIVEHHFNLVSIETKHRDAH